MFIFTALFFFATTNAADFPPYIETITESSRINWTTLRVEAVGKAQAPSNAPDYKTQELQAMTLANNSLQDAIFGINIDAKIDYQSLLNRDDSVSRYIESIVKRYDISDTIYHGDQSVEITTYISIHALLRGYVIERSQIDGRVAKRRGQSPTGVIIDARNMQFEPVLFPTIHTTTTSRWLTVDNFSKHTAQTKLPFMYATEAANPAVISRVGLNPSLYIAESSSNDTMTVRPVGNSNLTDQDVHSIMANGQVVILLQPQ